MISREEKRDRDRNKRQSKKREKNKNTRFNQFVFNFYSPTETEDLNKKVKHINISIIDEIMKPKASV